MMAKVAIIGAGPAGITAACELQSRGHEVTLFEQGSGSPPVRLNERERRKLIVDYPGRRSFVCDYGTGETPTVAPSRSGGLLGGGGAVWGGWVTPMRSKDLALASEMIHNGAYRPLSQLGYDLRDWPVDIGEFLACAREAETLIGTHLAATDDTGWRGELLAPLPENLRATFAPALLSESAQIRYGLSVERPIAELWPWHSVARAVSLGADLRHGARVLQLHIGRRPGGSVGVSYATCRASRRAAYRDSYELVGLACGAVQTVRLLLLSCDHISAHPSYQNLGRYTLFHVFGPRIIVSETSKSYPPLVSSVLSVVCVRIGQQQLRVPGGTLSVHARVAPLISRQAPDDYDPARHVIELRFTGTDLPARSNFIDLDPRHADPFGVPLARVHRLHSTIESQAYRVVARWLRSKLREIARDAFAGSSFKGDWRAIGDHQMGGCRMGSDPAGSVVSAGCRLYAAPNVVVFDGSSFPAAPGPFPTLAVVANALRVTRNL